ncbi:MAG: hypothetical protein AAF739_03195 [Pseudomonadota bacterium]
MPATVFQMEPPMDFETFEAELAGLVEDALVSGLTHDEVNAALQARADAVFEDAPGSDENE